jgi:hypothetical protein
MGETMEEERRTEIRDRLKAPRAGAIAGIVFSILLIISLVLTRVSVPATPGDAGTWLSGSEKSIRLALDLLPFAGIASCGSSVCCGTGSGHKKTASSPPCSSVVGSCFSLERSNHECGTHGRKEECRRDGSYNRRCPGTQNG